MNILSRLFLLALLVAGITIQSRSQTTDYKLIDSVKIPGEGGWDYLTIDTSMNRLYISHGTKVDVLDLDKNQVVGEIAPTMGVHGIALAPELDRGFTSNGRDSSVTVFDLHTLKTLATIKLNARNPDAITYDPFSRRVFTFNGGSSNTTAIDAGTDSIVGALALGGKPEFAVPDGKGKIYVNIEDKSQIVCFDTKALKILNTWPIAPGEEPSGLAMDHEHGRLFSVCGNKQMMVVDAASGKIVTSLPIGDGVDATAFDPATQLAFSSNGEGTLTVIHEESPDKFTVVGNVTTERGARTMALNKKTHRIYLPTAKYNPAPAPTADQPRPRRTVVPGSFTILIVGK
jgi:DNA-binding beta-propeller fold protein YncE